MFSRRSLVLIAVLVLAGLSPRASAADVATLLQHFENLALEPTSVRISQMKLTSGRLRLTLDNVAGAYVRAGDEVVGIFFKGKGNFAYSTEDSVEFPAIKTNLKTTKSNAKVSLDKNALTIEAPFTQLLWISGGAPLPELKGEEGASIERDFAAHNATIRLEVAGQRGTRFAGRKLNAPRAATIRIEFTGPEEWIYTRDEDVDLVESLEKLYTIEFEQRSRRTERYSAIIAQEPLSGDRSKTVAPQAVLTNVEYDVTAVDENVEIVVRETIVPNASGHRALWFMLDDTTYDNRGNRRMLQVRKVTAPDGAPVPWAQINHQVLVGLTSPTESGKPLQLIFELGGNVLLRPSSDNYWMLRGAWFPTFQLAGEAFTVRGITKVKAPFIPFAGGRTISRRTEDGFNILETAIDIPVGFLCIVAGKYHFDETRKDKLTVRTASYGQRNAQGIKKLTTLAFEMIAFYEYFLGPFPFEELNIIEINDFGWGQAPPGLVFITSEAFQPLLGDLNRLYSEGINERFAHEIAHQYWGWAVKIPSYEEEWLSESFAEYAAALVLRKAQGEGIYNRMVSTWRGNAKDARNSAPIPLANRLVTPNEFPYDRFYLLYSKGPYLLATLHKELGDQAFLTFLKSYQKTFRNKFGSTKDVSGLLSFMTKKDYKPFFDTYYWGTAIPDVK